MCAHVHDEIICMWCQRLGRNVRYGRNLYVAIPKLGKKGKHDWGAEYILSNFSCVVEISVSILK